jgi:hypothetical protein
MDRKGASVSRKGAKARRGWTTDFTDGTDGGWGHGGHEET